MATKKIKKENKKTNLKKVFGEKTEVGLEKKPQNWGLIVGMIVILGLAGWYVARSQGDLFRNTNNSNVTEEVKPEMVLPADWSMVSENSGGVAVRYEKNISSGKVKPVVTMVETDVQIAEAKSYSDRLLKGARSALPTLKIESDETKDIDGYYERDLSGSYYVGRNRVGLSQRLLIKDNKIYTLTGSYGYGDETLKQETINIFDGIYSAKIKGS